ncbi:MAG: type II toxin-antitoxin system VapC family toxin [Nitrospirae bacterium]|nr:type II toxin-antitoxin system VapC family toxin [Nitrospirota bacterium]
MIVYLDTSSLVKLYVEEVGSRHIEEIARAAMVISTSKIAYAETRAALARKQKEDGFSPATLRKITENLNREWESYFVIEVTDGLIRSAGDLAEKYLLRGFDAIHLASAINLQIKVRSAVGFSSNDLKLNQAARKEGLTLL